ncbi:sialidase family protein [Chitinophaga qingshengii]|uniref:Exo-alpha-sialidase n=1 Tax=Chitinophaga qingshengii TaxID=1569794 RepID=A0ABR7THM8_9BACT|nr:sialidase family protein [Chitinophaga qingshengii]MBC9928992.1 exo-alpha-sialidase [Chitinophaga qingshengii]
MSYPIIKQTTGSILILATLLVMACSKESNRLTMECDSLCRANTVPGVVVEHSLQSTQIYLGSPSVCILPDGSYVASCDLNSTLAPYVETPDTWVYLSTDKGKTWNKTATLQGQFWSQLFYHKGALYIMGTSKSGGDILIRRSDNKGQTWTNPVDGESGRIRQDGRYHCAPTPVISHNGRLWRGMEDLMGGGSVWGQSFRAFVISASDTSDLLKASSWKQTNRMPFNAAYLGGDFGGWLEGNAVVTPSGDVVDILRTNYQVNGDELASMIRISADGATASFDPSTGFVLFPGGCKKFTILYDSLSSQYWSISNYVPDIYKGGNAERTRNTLALLSSPDLLHWTVKGIVLTHHDILKHGFQYVDFKFDGQDIIFVSRTAFDDEATGANSQHNANFITFHRIQDYQHYVTPSIWESLMPH